MKEFSHSDIKPSPLDAAWQDEAASVRLTCMLLGLNDLELNELKDRIAKNRGVLFSFTHHEYVKPDLNGSYKRRTAAAVVGGVRKHVERAKRRADTPPVLLLEQESDISAVRNALGGPGVYFLATEQGTGAVPEATEKVLKDFFNIPSVKLRSRDANNHDDLSQIVYKILLRSLGVKRLIAGGMYLGARKNDLRGCATTLLVAAKSSGIPVSISNFQMDFEGYRNVRSTHQP